MHIRVEMFNLFCKHLQRCFFKLSYRRHTQKQDSSLYNAASSSEHSTIFKSTVEEDQLDYLFSSSPDLATVISSRRFFFSSPGRSNSIIEYNRNNNKTSSLIDLIPKGGVGVTKNSLDPYLDFRLSMQEMIDSRENSVDVRIDWAYLHELLFCYLALNHSHNHKYVVRAFTDLVVELLSSSSPQPPELKASHCRKLNGRRQGCFSGPLV